MTSDISMAFERDRIVGDVLHLGHYDEYTDAQRQELLDGIERLATRAIPEGDVDAAHASGAARALLRSIAFNPYFTAPEAREIPRRVLNIYHRSRSGAAKASAVNLLGDLLRQRPPETPQIVALLVDIASAPGHPGVGEDPPPPVDVSPWTAVRALQRACGVGRAALRRLHEEKLIDPSSLLATHIRMMAERGFPQTRNALGPLGEEIPCA